MTSAAVLADLSPLARRTLGETVYAALSELLASGQLGPGERLSLRDSAAALGVSVMPVREAVNRLVAEQALEVTPGPVYALLGRCAYSVSYRVAGDGKQTMVSELMTWAEFRERSRREAWE